MAIPLEKQFEVEKERNLKYLVLSLVLDLTLPLIHGLLFLWIPWILRSYRGERSLKFIAYFDFLKVTQRFNRTYSFKLFRRTFYFQPSLLFIAAIHLGLNAFFCVAQTAEINYEPRLYVVSKRLGLVSVAQVPPILLLVTKNNFVSAVSGLSEDKSVFFHKWIGRFMFVSATLHMALSLSYWIGLKFYIMVHIPPQIFGFIAFSCLGMMNFGSLRFIRKFSFELFLAQHRIFNFVFLLLLYFHNGRTHFAVLLGVHLLVLDRIVGRVLGILHKRKGPTKGKCDFEILDEDTMRVSIPITVFNSDAQNWWWSFVPRYGNWRAGQHVLFNCNKVALLAYHPFTISSLPSSGRMVLVIRKKSGFTRKLFQKLQAMENEEDKEECIEVHSIRSESDTQTEGSELNAIKAQDIEVTTVSENSLHDLLSRLSKQKILNLKAGINGPFGGLYQPLVKFESVTFLSAGSGSSFTLPVALELLHELEKRNQVQDFLYRPNNCAISIHVVFQKISHLKWYDHLWEDFYPYLAASKVQLYLYFTKESQEIASVGNEKNDSDATSSSDLFDNGVMNSGDGVTVSYCRPNIAEVVAESARSFESSSNRCSIAYLSCGPANFNFCVEKACDKARRQNNSPDLYYYREAYD